MFSTACKQAAQGPSSPHTPAWLPPSHLGGDIIVWMDSKSNLASNIGSSVTQLGRYTIGFVALSLHFGFLETASEK